MCVIVGVLNVNRWVIGFDFVFKINFKLGFVFKQINDFVKINLFIIQSRDFVCLWNVGIVVKQVMCVQIVGVCICIKECSKIGVDY